MKYVFIAAVAAIIARGILGLINPSALNAPIPPPPLEPVKGHVTVIAEGPADTISGHLYDAKSDEPQAGNGAAVIVGTNRGASTGLHGEYTITGVPPGKYELEASSFGHRTVKTSITLDSLTGLRVDFRLSVPPIELGHPVE